MFARRSATADTQIRLGVGVIVRNATGQILLEKRSDNGLWGPPGGRIEPGESVAEAAVREVREETGLTVEVTRLVGVYSEPADRIVTYLDNGDVRHLVDVMVEATILSGTLTCSLESEDLAFYFPEALPTDLVPPARRPLEDYLGNRLGILR
jgi:8-oxo-dGTP pyrophosphatase MutT (NUDIX family)